MNAPARATIHRKAEPEVQRHPILRGCGVFCQYAGPPVQASDMLEGRVILVDGC